MHCGCDVLLIEKLRVVNITCAYSCVLHMTCEHNNTNYTCTQGEGRGALQCYDGGITMLRWGHYACEHSTVQ